MKKRESAIEFSGNKESVARGRVRNEMDRWLRGQTASYNNPDRVCVDVEVALARFPSLRPKSDVYSTSIYFLFVQFMSDREHSIRRWPRAAPSLHTRSHTNLFQGIHLQHTHRHLAHKGLPSQPTHRLRRAHPHPPHPTKQARRSQRQMLPGLHSRLDQKTRGSSSPLRQRTPNLTVQALQSRRPLPSDPRSLFSGTPSLRKTKV